MKKILPALLAALLFSTSALAAPLPGGDADLPVDVTADSMEYSADKNTVVFHGKVEAVRQALPRPEGQKRQGRQG